MPETAAAVSVVDVWECVDTIIGGGDQRLDMMDPRTKLIERCGSVGYGFGFESRDALSSSGASHEPSIHIEHQFVITDWPDRPRVLVGHAQNFKRPHARLALTLAGSVESTRDRVRHAFSGLDRLGDGRPGTDECCRYGRQGGASASSFAHAPNDVSGSEPTSLYGIRFPSERFAKARDRSGRWTHAVDVAEG